MFSKKLLMFLIAFLGVVFAASVCFGSSGDIEWPGCCSDDPVCDEPPCEPCDDCDDFTKEFPLQECRYFKTIGKNLYFKLIPGYKLVLESDEEKAEITVLWETKKIRVPGVGKINTRVVEERAYEWDEDDDEWVTIEISLNWFAICKKTNAVYYFGEWSRDCEDGFDENDQCEDESNAGSWEAGVDGAMPGLIMPATFVLGAKYCQEQAPSEDSEEAAVDRGENVKMGVNVKSPAGKFKNCVMVVDTNPAEGVCDPDDGDEKIYCPDVGLVQDGDLELVEYGYEDYPPWCRYR
jgi:hypothetical protein